VENNLKEDDKMNDRILELLEMDKEVEKLIEEISKVLNITKDADLISKVKKIVEENKILREENMQLMQAISGLIPLKIVKLQKESIENRIIYSDKWFVVCTIDNNKYNTIFREGKVLDFIDKLQRKGWHIVNE